MTVLCSPAVRGRGRRGLQTSRPGSALTSPAACRPPAAPDPRTASFGPGCRHRSGRAWLQRRRGRGLRFRGTGKPQQRRLDVHRGSKLPRANSGSWLVAKLQSFPDALTPHFFLKAGRVSLHHSPKYADVPPSEPSFAPAGYLVSEALPFNSTPKPGSSAPQVDARVQNSLLPGKE